MLFLSLFALPFLVAFLCLYWYTNKKGDTSSKRTTYRIATRTHGIALALALLSLVLSFAEIILRWGLSWYICIVLILSGITMFLTIPKNTAHRMWWKVYSGIYAWGMAVAILFWFPVMYILAAFSYNSPDFENRQFRIYDTSPGTYHPKYHVHVIFTNNGPFMKKQSAFQYDKTEWDIYDVKEGGDGTTIQVYLHEREDDTQAMPRDTILTLKINN